MPIIPLVKNLNRRSIDSKSVMLSSKSPCYVYYNADMLTNVVLNNLSFILFSGTAHSPSVDSERTKKY